MAEQDDDADPPLAAEFALGVLDAEQRAQLVERCRVDPPFARDVAEWQARLTPLSEAIAPVAAPASVWTRIEAALASQPLMPQPMSKRTDHSLWDSLSFWRWLSAGSLTLAAASFAAFLVAPALEPSTSGFAGVLTTQDGAPAFSVTIDRQSSSAILVAMRSFGDPQQVNELWLVPRTGDPIPLAIVGHGVARRVPLLAGALSGGSFEGALAVSLEPPGGSPTGKPTGPIVAHGPLLDL